MTTQQKLQAVREVIVVAVPEIMELRRDPYFLDSVEVSNVLKDTLRDAYNARFNKDLDYDQWVGINDHLETCGKRLDVLLYQRYSLNREAIGRSIGLEDVLRAMPSTPNGYAVDTSGEFLKSEDIYRYNFVPELIKWHLGRSLDQQPESVIDFLFQILVPRE